MEAKVCADQYGTWLSTDIECQPGMIDFDESGTTREWVTEVKRACDEWLKKNLE